MSSDYKFTILHVVHVVKVSLLCNCVNMFLGLHFKLIFLTKVNNWFKPSRNVDTWREMCRTRANRLGQVTHQHVYRL